MNKKNFINNFAITSLTNILFLIIALSNNILITRYLGPSQRGLYAVVSNLVIFINLFLGEGIRRSNTIIIGKNNKILSKLLFTNLIYFFALSIILAILFVSKPFLKDFLPNISDLLLVLALIISFFTMLWQALQGIYLGLGEITTYNLLMLSSIVFILIFNLIGIYFFHVELVYILGNLILSSFIVYLIGLLGILKLLNFKITFKMVKFRQLISYSSRSTFTSIVIYILQRSGIFFMNYFAGKANSGYFAVSMVFSDLILRFPNVAATLVFSKTSNEKKNSSYLDVAKVIRIMLLFGILVSITLLLLGKPIIVFLFGERYLLAFDSLQFMLLGLLLVGPGSIIHSYFMGKGYPKQMLILNLVSSLLTLFLYYILIAYFGLKGAGAAYSLAIFIWTVSYFFLFKYTNKLSYKQLLIINKSDLQIIYSYLVKTINSTIFKINQ